MIPKAERTVQGNLPLHRPVQVAQTNLKLREVLLNSLLAYLTVYGFSVGVGPSGDAMIPKADRLWYVQGNLPLHRPVQVIQTNLKLLTNTQLPSTHNFAQVQSRQEFT